LKKVNALIRNQNTNIIKYKGKTLDQIYNKYVSEYNKKYPPRLRKNPREPIIRVDTDIRYPFKSKLKYQDNEVESTQPKDYRLKQLNKFMRPYYSPNLGSYEVDIVYSQDPKYKNRSTYYFFAININTKFLIVYPLSNMSKNVISDVLNKLVNENYVSNIRGDGEFVNFKIPNVSIYTNSSPFVNHNRVVDRVIRTIRDAIGNNDYDFSNPETLNKIVAIYNKAPHSSLKLPTRKIPFTPEEVNENHDIEGIFIKMNQ
jgi:hypothetical protein